MWSVFKKKSTGYLESWTSTCPHRRCEDLCSETATNEEWSGEGCSDLGVGMGRGSNDLQKSLVSSPQGGWSCGFPEIDGLQAWNPSFPS